MGKVTKRLRDRPKQRRTVKKEKRFYVDLQKQMRDPILKKQWCNKQSVTANLSKISLDEHRAKCPEQHTSDPIALSNDHAGILRHLIAKYAHDTKAMTKDIKLNIWQWTERQICKKLELFHKNRIAKEF